MRFIFYITLMALAGLARAQQTTGSSIIQTFTSVDTTGPQTNLDSCFYQFTKLRESVFIDFREGFDDSVFVYLNEQCVFRDYLKTNYSIDHAGSMIAPVCDSTGKPHTISICFKSAAGFIREELKRGFSHLEIRKSGQWRLYYSNRFYLAE